MSEFVDVMMRPLRAVEVDEMMEGEDDGYGADDGAMRMLMMKMKKYDGDGLVGGGDDDCGDGDAHEG